MNYNKIYLFLSLLCPMIAFGQSNDKNSNRSLPIEKSYEPITPDSLAFNDSLWVEGEYDNHQFAGYASALVNGERLFLYPELSLTVDHQRGGVMISQFTENKRITRILYIADIPLFPSYNNCYSDEKPQSIFMDIIDSGCSYSAVYLPLNEGEKRSNHTYIKIISYDPQTKIMKARFEGKYYIYLRSEHDVWNIDEVEILDGVFCARVNFIPPRLCKNLDELMNSVLRGK